MTEFAISEDDAARLAKYMREKDKVISDREYREKRLMVAVAIIVATQYTDAQWALKSADDLIRANQEMAVPE